MSNVSPLEKYLQNQKKNLSNISSFKYSMKMQQIRNFKQPVIIFFVEPPSKSSLNKGCKNGFFNQVAFNEEVFLYLQGLYCCF